MKALNSWLRLRAAGVAIASSLLLSAGFSTALADEDALFDDISSIGEEELASNSGGTQLNLGDLGLNYASNNAEMVGNSVSGNVNTGQISNNSLNDVNGINSLMFNTGNNVNFQSNMQINIFLK